MEENKTIGKQLEGAINYMIIVGDDVDVKFEQSNENNLVAFIAVQSVYEELWEKQMAPGSPEGKMNKAELKELQVSKEFLKKHIAMLGKFVENKYKNAIPTADKPKIQVVSPLTDSHLIPKDIRTKGK